MTTTTRADWGNVTLGVYNALYILQRGNVEERLNRYWDSRAAIDPFDTGPGTRLTDIGRIKLSELIACVNGADENATISAARQFVEMVGVPTVAGVTRSPR